jgi:amino acid transporter
LKRWLIGRPIATRLAHHERLVVFFGLALLASDNISVIAYATEEIMHMLGLAGPEALSYVLPLAWATLALVIIVLFSYSRTIANYPQGGGDYRVATDNIGPLAGKIAGAALLIDYTLTVAVSVSAGVLAIVSAVPGLQPYIVHMGLSAIVVLALVNLRGTRESGLVFAIPTYAFVLLMVLLIVFGIPKLGSFEGVPTVVEHEGPREALTLWLILRAFAAGCAALTGIEAIANGTMVFRAPEVKNAIKALVSLGAIMVVLFLGVTWLASHYPVRLMSADEAGYKTVVAQIAQGVFGNGFMFYAIQIATMAILILAANTAFADFPRLASFMARDGYLPRQFASLGDRLVFQNGIVILGVVAGLLVVFAQGNVHKLIPLYALGVFTAFTLGQAGMVIKQWRDRKLGGALVSGIGALATGVVWVVILVTKFVDGAWMIVIAMGGLLFMFSRIRRHYDYLAKELNVRPEDRVEKYSSTVLLLVPRLHRGLLKAISYAKAMTSDVRAVHVTLDPQQAKATKEQWTQFGADIPLVILDSPYRSLVDPVIEYVDQTIEEARDPNHMVTVIVAEAVPKNRFQQLLHSNLGLFLKIALGRRRNVVISNVRYFLD